MKIEEARFVAIGWHRVDMSWRMSAHAHPFHEMILILQGSQYVAVAGKEIRAEAGDILFYPQGVPHEEWIGRGQSLESYYLSFNWAGCPRDAPLHLRDRRARVRVLMDWLHSERETHTPLTPGIHRTLLHALLGQFLGLWMRREDGFVEAIRRFVREHIDEPFMLDDLAAEIGMSKYNLVRKYRSLTGRTPMEDVRIIRVEYARELVLTSSLALKAIAPKAGLGDAYHMSRLFQRYLGIRPGSLRKGINVSK